jgi:hypothetical protein
MYESEFKENVFKSCNKSQNWNVKVPMFFLSSFLYVHVNLNSNDLIQIITSEYKNYSITSN